MKANQIWSSIMSSCTSSVWSSMMSLWAACGRGSMTKVFSQGFSQGPFLAFLSLDDAGNVPQLVLFYFCFLQPPQDLELLETLELLEVPASTTLGRKAAKAPLFLSRQVQGDAYGQSPAPTDRHYS
eukprot:1159223-Pelagomonas_calceolata.AAC.6